MPRKDANDEDDAPLSRRGSLLPAAPGAIQVSAFFQEEDEPEPLSFAPGRIRRQSERPGALLTADDTEFEAVSARFRNIPGDRRSGSDHALHERAKKMISEVSAEIRSRAEDVANPHERERLRAYSESIDKLLESTLALHYLEQPKVAQDISAYLHRYKASQRAWEHDPELRDIVLKASVTAIHMAPCLGFWRTNPNVPEEVQKLLTAENVFGSVFRIAKERKQPWLDRLLADYNKVTSNLRGTVEHGIPITIKTRNPVLWPWCKYNIKNVTYALYRSDASLAPGEDTLADVKVALVVFNVLLDDVADNLQRADLLGVLLEIPTAGGTFGIAPKEAYTRLMNRLRDIGWAGFGAYFDLAVDTWVTALIKLKEVVGVAYDDLLPDLARDYDLILKAMQFSVDLNNRPSEILRLGPDALAQSYSSPDFGSILAHNANRGAFFTIDLMALRAFDEHQYSEIVSSGAADVYRESALIFQDMQQIGNSVATGARETDSDDVTNDLFKIAHDRLNTTDDWPLPDYLASLPGITRKDALLNAFVRKKAAKEAMIRCHPESVHYHAAQREYVALGEDIERMVALSGAEHYYFHRWLQRREEAVDLFYETDDWVDRYQIVNANDLVLVLHLMYKGRI